MIECLESLSLPRESKPSIYTSLIGRLLACVVVLIFTSYDMRNALHLLAERIKSKLSSIQI